MAEVVMQAGIAALEKRNGQVLTAARALRQELASFARNKRYAQAIDAGEHANLLDSPSAAPSGARVTVAEAAARSGYSPQYVRRLCASGELEAVRSPGGAWLVDEWSLEVLAARRERDAGCRQAG